MDYVSIYAQFIRSRKGLAPSGYSELHHIHPVSLGGGDVPANLLSLSARDHYFAHCLLAKIYGGKMWSALHSMTAMRKRGRRFAQGRMVAIARREGAKVRSANMAELWSNGSFHRQREYTALSEDTKQKIADGNKGKRRSAEHIAKVVASKRANAPTAAFVHETGTRFIGSALDLNETHVVSKDMARLLIRGKVLSASGWRLEGTDPRAVLGRDPVVRTFVNRDGRTFDGTTHEFRKAFSLDAGVISNLIHGKNRVKSFKGWSLPKA